MADQNKMDPDIIGKGAAYRAGKQLQGRKAQIDAAVDEATGDTDPTQPEREGAKQLPSEPAAPPEKMSTHLMRRIAEMIRGKKSE
jgi:hypothetical protein